jgi:hypothetical protein
VRFKSFGGLGREMRVLLLWPRPLLYTSLSLSLSLSLNLKGKLCLASAFKRNGDSVWAVTRAAVSLFLPSTHRFTPTQTVVDCLFAVARDSQLSFDYVYSCTRSRQRKHTAHLHTCCWLAGCRFLFPFFSYETREKRGCECTSVTIIREGWQTRRTTPTFSWASFSPCLANTWPI